MHTRYRSRNSCVIKESYQRSLLPSFVLPNPGCDFSTSRLSYMPKHFCIFCFPLSVFSEQNITEQILNIRWHNMLNKLLSAVTFRLRLSKKPINNSLIKIQYLKDLLFTSLFRENLCLAYLALFR